MITAQQQEAFEKVANAILDSDLACESAKYGECGLQRGDDCAECRKLKLDTIVKELEAAENRGRKESLDEFSKVASYIRVEIMRRMQQGHASTGKVMCLQKIQKAIDTIKERIT